MARDSFLKTAAPLVVLTFLGVYNFPAVTQEFRGHNTNCHPTAAGSRLAYFQIGLCFQSSGKPIERNWPAKRVYTKALTRSGKVVSGL